MQIRSGKQSKVKIPVWSYALLLILTATFLQSETAHAGELIISNMGPSTAVCAVDGYSGTAFSVPSGAQSHVIPNYSLNTPMIDWIQCSSGSHTLRTRGMHITSSGPNGLTLLNGRQTRVLNVLLYSYIPTYPAGNFQGFTTHAIEVFQAKYPDILLNAVMNSDIDIYDFNNLRSNLLSSNGYDVLELDTVFMGFLKNAELILPQEIKGDTPWPAGLRAATVDGTLYGIPSWLCNYFIYAFDPAITQVQSLEQFLAYLRSQPTTRVGLVADFNGSWTIPSMYINGYVQAHNGNISGATQMPPEQAVIKNLALLVSNCTFDSKNSCVDGTFHSGPDGLLERKFATGNSNTAMAFSERSFYIQMYQTVGHELNAAPSVWGQTKQPVLFTDAFVTNRATCKDSCISDSQQFTTLMTGSSMKTYVAFSEDLPSGSPARHLLVATMPFWDTNKVQQDPLYQQFKPVLAKGIPYPNNFNPDLKKQMFTQVCAALKQLVPQYVCGD